MCKLKEILGGKSGFRGQVLAVTLNSWQSLNCPLEGFQDPLTEVRPPNAWTRARPYVSSLTKVEEGGKKGVNNNDNKVVVWPAEAFLTRVMATPAMTRQQRARWWNSFGQPGQSWWARLDNSINSDFIVSSCAAHGNHGNANDTSYFLWLSS